MTDWFRPAVLSIWSGQSLEWRRIERLDERSFVTLGD